MTSGKQQMSDHGSHQTVQVNFVGRVQGVGFRATTHQLAQQFLVAGYVRNLPDGSVELVAQGAKDEIDRFLAAVRQRFANKIQSSNQTPIASDDRFGAFEVW